MQEFINQAISQLGITQAQGETATGGALALLKNNLDGDAFAKINEKLPGAQGLLEGFLANKGEGQGGGRG